MSAQNLPNVIFVYDFFSRAKFRHLVTLINIIHNIGNKSTKL